MFRIKFRTRRIVKSYFWNSNNDFNKEAERKFTRFNFSIASNETFYCQFYQSVCGLSRNEIKRFEMEFRQCLLHHFDRYLMSDNHDDDDIIHVKSNLCRGQK